MHLQLHRCIFSCTDAASLQLASYRQLFVCVYFKVLLYCWYNLLFPDLKQKEMRKKIFFVPHFLTLSSPPPQQNLLHDWWVGLKKYAKNQKNFNLCMFRSSYVYHRIKKRQLLLRQTWNVNQFLELFQKKLVFFLEKLFFFFLEKSL